MERTYSFVKNVRGGLAITLDAYDMQMPTKRFVIPHTVTKVVIPYKYALGLFISRGALDQYKLGYFTIDDVEELIKDALEKGLCAAEDYPEISSLVNITNMIKENDTKKIRKLLDNGTKVEIDNLLDAARDNLGTLNTVNKNLIETKCGCELEIE